MENIDWVWLFTGFEGRINRAKFWIGWLIIFVVNLIVGRILGVTSFLALLVSLALVYATVAIGVKRLHDRGKPGWWLLFFLIPLVGWIWALVELGILPGAPGENEYGPDPLAA